MRTLLAFVAMLPFLAACSGEGPRDGAILRSATATVLEPITPDLQYAVIEVNKDVSERVSGDLYAAQYSGFFKDTGSAPVVIGAGDTLSISIISSSSTTGFVDFAGGSLNPISTATLPPQEVSSDGTVNVPPIGRVLARGKSVQGFENFVRRRLADVLVEPSAVVQLTTRKSARVTVVGDVAGPGAIPLSTTEPNLVDIITAAGGPVGRAEDLDLMLTRRGRSATIPLQDLYSNPRYNIAAHAGDIITVRSPLTEVTVLGAFASNTRIRLEGPSVTLVETIGQLGGLTRDRAKLKGVYVYRETPRATLAGLGADLTAFPAEPLIPTIYRFDFTDPTAFFTADTFVLANGDILYTTQSALAEINDTLSAILPVATAPRTLNPAD